jgi:predicted house-cleaning noncanonical NTP pyrophosphatase (MazG superfamily)
MSDEQKDNDYEYTRETLYDLIEKGREGIEEMIEVARQSEHPRAYEVLAGLIKDTANTSEKLMDLHRKIKSLDQMMLPPPTDNNTTTNNLFIGSTTELQRMLKDLKDEDIKDVTPKEDPEILRDFLW